MAWRPFRNIGLKVAALALGAMLWFTLNGRQVERRLPAAVSYGNIHAGLEMTGDQLDTVSVRVRGGDNAISGLGPNRLQIVVDLSTAHEGPNPIILRTDEVVAPADVEVMQIDPGTLTVALEQSGQLSVPVHPIIDGTPAAGHRVSRVTVEPATVVVLGPVSRLKGAVNVVTGPVSVDGRAATFSEDVSVGVDDAQLRLPEPRTVRVTVRIE
jgi:YbbR domain-containing protein